MPAAASSKRVKNTRVSRPFIIGSQAWELTAANRPASVPAEHTKGWRIYVRGLDSGPDITTWLKKVQFKLHFTYADASRTVEAPPFAVQETGYGEFDIELRLYFDSSSGEKAQYRLHRLRLEPYGSDEQQRKQRAANLVTAETCEIVEFNEPSQEFFAKMTSEDQFAHLQKKGGGAKGRSGAGGGGGAKGRGGKAVEYEGGREPTAGFPERGTEASPWSKDLEKKMVDMLGNAQKELDAAIEAERQKAVQRQKRMAEVS
ncbi:hypothetical protein MBLNU459_g8274t1 [Dothideomycetes sp. NU459]